MIELNENTAQKLHESYYLIDQVEVYIFEIFEKYESEIVNKKDFDFEIASDDYDNSLEIYFKCSIPYPYEPSLKTRQDIQKLGFDIIYWNFLEDKIDDTYDEIRGYEPRHARHSTKNYPWMYHKKYGYVDKRFDEKEWCKKYNFLNR